MFQHTTAQGAGLRLEHERQARFARESLSRRPQAGTRERMPRAR